MKVLIVLGLVFMISGCGTTRTVLMGDDSTRKQMAKAKTYCGALPRVYSGVSYDFCLFHAEPRAYKAKVDNRDAGPPFLEKVSPDKRRDFPPDRAFDFFFSGIADTLVLPYTIFRQVRDGKIVLD